MTMVSAVMVQMTTVSMNGSNIATKPSLTGCLVFTAEWAMGAEPTPASLEKAARWKPMMRTPMAPPATTRMMMTDDDYDVAEDAR